MPSFDPANVGRPKARANSISPDNPFADLIPSHPERNARSYGATLPPGFKLDAQNVGADNPFAHLVARRARRQQRKRAIGPSSSWADIAGQAADNLLPSTQRFGSDIWDAVTDPRQTVRSLKNVAFGAAEKLVPGEQSHEKYADAVGRFFASRYGGMEAFKKTLAEDPVGFAADLATLLSGGELALARAPGVVGTVARAAGSVGRAVDPINASLKAAGTVARGVSHVGAAIGGVTTGVGGQAPPHDPSRWLRRRRCGLCFPRQHARQCSYGGRDRRSKVRP
jgi:hypothetical protein